MSHNSNSIIGPATVNKADEDDIREVNVWNDLPANIVDFRSLQSFKKTVSTVDLSRYLSDTYS